MGWSRVNDAEANRVAGEIAIEAAEQEANAIRNRLVRTTPRDSGRTASGWDVRVVSRGPRAHVQVVNSVSGQGGTPIWRFLHEGTGRFGPTGRDIVPVRKRALRWRDSGSAPLSRSRGGYVFSKRSKGSPPNGFVYEAILASGRSGQWRIRHLVPPGTRIP